MQHDTKPKPSVLGAETAKVADLVSYQGGSIVSHEILKKPTGTVTVFAFDEGQGLSEHTAPFDALVQVLEGEVEIRIAARFHREIGGEWSTTICLPKKKPALEIFFSQAKCQVLHWHWPGIGAWPTNKCFPKAC